MGRRVTLGQVKANAYHASCEARAGIKEARDWMGYFTQKGQQAVASLEKAGQEARENGLDIRVDIASLFRGILKLNIRLSKGD